MRKHSGEVLFILLAATLIIGSLTFYITGRAHCSDKGGDYVRGAVWYVCTNEEEP